MTKQEFEARQLIGNWLAKNKIKPTHKLRHVHPRCYVVGYAAPMCLIVAAPWIDSESNLKDFDKRNPMTMVYKFDQNLKTGDWCAIAYYCADGIQETCAVSWSKA